jgi:hypothetical protein
MRVRIRQDAEYPNKWYVESKWWFSLGWMQRTSISALDAKERALAVAVALRNPNVIEVT